MDIKHSDVLIVVDVQNDFLPGGALGVPGGDAVLQPINAVMPLFSYVVASRDWHPREHPHFEEYGGPWPYHCLQHTDGARFAADLSVDAIDFIVSKGTDAGSHGYDAFDGTGLHEHLRDRGARHIFVCGLATDYCVRATALASVRHGFETFVIRDAIAAVNVRAHDGANALSEMAAHGVRFVESGELRAVSRTPA